jgi:hypothetical protein
MTKEFIPRLRKPATSLPLYAAARADERSWPISDTASAQDRRLFGYCANIVDREACNHEEECGYHTREVQPKSKLGAYQGCLPRKFGGRGYFFTDPEAAASRLVQVTGQHSAYLHKSPVVQAIHAIHLYANSQERILTDIEVERYRDVVQEWVQNSPNSGKLTAGRRKAAVWLREFDAWKSKR